jgi:hypothetical protein
MRIVGVGGPALLAAFAAARHCLFCAVLSFGRRLRRPYWAMLFCGSAVHACNGAAARVAASVTRAGWKVQRCQWLAPWHTPLLCHQTVWDTRC